jgi:hypothetical protein
MRRAEVADGNACCKIIVAGGQIAVIGQIGAPNGEGGLSSAEDRLIRALTMFVALRAMICSFSTSLNILAVYGENAAPAGLARDRHAELTANCATSGFAGRSKTEARWALGLRLRGAGSRGRTARFSDHEPVKVQKLRRPFVAVVLATDFLQNEFHCGSGHIGNRLMDRGQCRPDSIGNGRVIEADDRNVAGNIEPEAVCHERRRGSHVVIGSENRRGSRPVGEQLFGGLEAGPIGKVPLLDAHLPPIDPALSQRGQKPAEPLCADGLIGMSRNETKAPMSQAQEVFRELASRRFVVDAHRRQVGTGVSGCDRHNDDAGAAHYVQQGL